MIPQFSSDPLHGPSLSQQHAFRSWLQQWFAQNRRSFSWREHITPYRVFVSEVMLQQTQTSRITQRFEDFVQEFSSFASLATAETETLLRAWQGLGYNRRALYLRDAARIVVQDYQGELPADEKLLQDFPGIGPATAASIRAFAFDLPSVFVETNIRSLLLYVFFSQQPKVAEVCLINLLRQMIPENGIREWYYALTDAGVLVKSLFGNQNKRSTVYTKQTPFVGSRREVRGKLLRQLLDLPLQSSDELALVLKKESNLVAAVLEELAQEGLVRQIDQLWMI